MFTLPFLLLLAACGPEKKALRETHREEATLTERADRCWAALRWGDTAAASACVSETDDRVANERWVASASAEKRLTETTVIRVAVGAPLDPPQNGRVREATVVVRAESYGVRDQVLHSETVVQRWYKDEHDWYVEWP